MFYHGYDSYMKYAFPHDELRPISRTYTDSLGELGNLNREHLSEEYRGVALTLIDSMSTLAVLGNTSEFAKNVRWLEANLNFDVDVRVNAFECNIRVLGGLLSAHVLAGGDGGDGGEVGGVGGKATGEEENGGQSSSTERKRGGVGVGDDGDERSLDRSRQLSASQPISGSRFAADGGVGRSMGPPVMPSYRGGLLRHALDLGRRLLVAFDTSTGMPYAWVNLKTGVRAGEVTETNVAAVGSFILEFGLLSRLTEDPRFEAAAVNAIRALWGLRGAHTNLLGNTLDVQTGTWINRSGGIGAGCDSFFEYLLKAYPKP
jgi:mannosidase alpha-like ER degradation enhancer 1